MTIAVGQKILIVDDKPENLFALEKLLQPTGAEITKAGSGNEALIASLHDEFALAILDVQMPIMDGYELAEHLRSAEKTRRLPIIFLTAVYSDEAHIFRGYEAGAVDFITKPYRPEVLLCKVEIFLQLDRQKRELQEKIKLERAKRYLEDILLTMTESVMVISQETIIQTANGACFSLLGYKKDEIVGMSIESILPDEECINLIRGLEASETKEFRNRETFLKDRTGQDIAVLLSGATFHSPIAENRGAVLVARDIRERKTLEGQLRQAQKMEAIGTLAGGIAHDFNNILGIIFGYTEMALMSDSDPTSIHASLEEVLNGARRARDLVKQILAFARQGEEQSIPVKVALIVKEAMKMLRASLPATIEIRQNISSQGIVMTDPSKIHQIVMNLCTNAHHAMREHGGVLAVSLEDSTADSDQTKRGLKPGPHMKLTVADTGSGIEPAMMERIFDPYFTTKPTGEGTGLGLAVVHGIVTGLGGYVGVESTAGKGSTFEIWLPIARQHRAEKTENGSAPLPRGEERVLVVEDESTLLDIAKRMLQNLGYHITAQSDSVAALELFRTDPQRFDLVLTDQTLPKLTGGEMARQMLAIRPDIPIIICTGFSDLINAEKAQHMGIKRLIMKPLSMKNLATTVRGVLDEKD